MENKKIVQTAGRDKLNEFAPDFAHYNDDILFGENWNNQDIDLKTRCIITVVALMSSGITDSSLIYHLQNAKSNGVTRKEIASIITHVGFYVGWPKAWALFNLAKTIWTEDSEDEKINHVNKMIFPLGEENKAYEKYFSGKSYLAPISTSQVNIFNVTFEPGCRNNWHIHNAKSGGGQILICIEGHGIYQEWGKDPIMMNPGDVVNIPSNVKHFHGARKDSFFSHLAIEVPGVDCSNTWLEKVTDEQYEACHNFKKD